MRSSVALMIVALVVFGSGLNAQVKEFGESGWPGFNGDVIAIAEDSANYYVGGAFTSVGTIVGAGSAIDLTTGVPNFGGVNVDGAILTAIRDGSNGWYIGGSFTTINGFSGFSNLAHITAGGNGIDFGWVPQVNNQVRTLLLDGTTIYAGGLFTIANGQTRNRLAAFNTSGTLQTWNPNSNNTVYAMAINGTTIYLGGVFTTMGGQTRNFVAAVNTSGTLQTWNPNANNFVNALAIGSSNIYIGGSFTTIAGQTRNRLAAVDSSGSLLSFFNPNVGNGEVNTLLISGTNLYVGGSFSSVSGQTRNNAARVSTGGPLQNWNPNANGAVWGFALSGGNVYLGGFFTTISGQPRLRLAAVSSVGVGSLQSWDPSADSLVFTLGPPINGSLYAGGSFTTLGTVTRNNVAAISKSTREITAWDPDVGGVVYSIVVDQPTIYLGGSFTSVKGQTRNRLAAVNAGGGLLSWNPNANSTVRAMTIVGTTVYVGGQFSTMKGQSRNRLAAITTGDSLLGWNPNADATARALTSVGTDIYIGGDFVTVGGQTRNRLAAVDSSGALLSWNPNANSNVNTLTTSGTDIYIGGTFTTLGGQTRSRLAAVDLAGALLPWNPNSNATVEVMVTSGSTIQIGGQFTTMGGQTRNRLAGVFTDGTLTDWAPDVQGTSGPRILAMLPGSLLVGGHLDTVNGDQNPNFALFEDAEADLELHKNSSTGPMISNPDTVDLGTIDKDAGATTPCPIIVENNDPTLEGSGDPIYLGMPVLVSGDISEFSVDLSSFSNTVFPDSSTSFTVSFDPSAEGSFSAVLSFPHSDLSVGSPFTITLTGIGTCPGPPATFGWPNTTYCGDQVFMMGTDSSGQGAGTIVQFDANDDGSVEATGTTDENGLVTASLSATSWPGGSGSMRITSTTLMGGVSNDLISVSQTSTDCPSNAVKTTPINQTNDNVAGCVCAGGLPHPGMLGQTNEPVSENVALNDGTGFFTLPVLAYPTLLDQMSSSTGNPCPADSWSATAPAAGIDYSLTFQSGTDYDGPNGASWASSYNSYIVANGGGSATVYTPDMSCYEATDVGGGNWSLDGTGMYSGLVLDSNLNRWYLEHHSGACFEYVEGQQGLPGNLIGVTEPSGQKTSMNCDASGLLSKITSDLDQELEFFYNIDSQVERIRDHIGREWFFNYDPTKRLASVDYPTTTFVDIAAGVLVTDENPTFTTKKRRVSFTYDTTFTNQIATITDERGAVPIAYEYYPTSDLGARGRVSIKRVNGQPIQYFYEGQSSPISGPAFLPKLETQNRWTRVIDREGNVCDYEMHSATGNPTPGFNNQGKFGKRRKICWTARGLTGTPLRSGTLPNGLPEEPLYWEQRWVQNCDCLAPMAITQPFRNDDPDIVGEDGNKVPLVKLSPPVYYPTRFYTYNSTQTDLRRQVEQCDYRGFSKDGVNIVEEVITWTANYQDFNPALGQYSRRTSYTPPRAFDSNPINAGLTFTHTYQWDSKGRKEFHFHPAVNRGPVTEAGAVESWTYTSEGQVDTYTDENGNVTDYDYYTSTTIPSLDINEFGAHEGYLHTVTRGATGSSDSVVLLQTEYFVNALGMVTQMDDPNNHRYITTYNDLGEVTLTTQPSVTVPFAATYTTESIYDGAGNVIMTRRDNIDHTGVSVGTNLLVDSSSAYDAVGNVVETSVEADAGGTANDLSTNYVYDNNDQLIIVESPEGNRTFNFYDERRLSFKSFYGIEPGATIDEDYPYLDKTATTLGTANFVGYTTTTYDARYNTIRVRDGRDHFVDSFPDFYNRTIATADQNSFGMAYEYDDDSLLLTTQGGEIDKVNNGAIVSVLERTYNRYDERGRRYQTVLDLDLSVSNDESGEIDPSTGPTGSLNSNYLTLFDEGSRVEFSDDANGNRSDYEYDSANRTKLTRDALNNEVIYSYDANSNVTEIEEREILEDQTGGYEEYFTMHEYDELNRRIKTRIRGLDHLIDHQTQYFHDSLNFTRQVIDAEGKVTESDRDDASRTIETRRLDGVMTPTVLVRNQFAYDDNSRKLQDIAYTDAVGQTGQQTTQYGYDNLNRLVVTVYPDSDNTITTSGTAVEGIAEGVDGASGFDRVEVGYDENSNVTNVTEQRGVGFVNTYDDGNRLTRQDMSLVTGVLGEKLRTFEYDELNRITEAKNDYARVSRFYDPLSRLTDEVQRIRLDGKGHTNGWKHPITIHSGYDKQSNRDVGDVLEGPLGAPTNTDLNTTWSYDPLNRKDIAKAAYFGTTLTEKAEYQFQGPWRLQKKCIGGTAALGTFTGLLVQTFDEKRRTELHFWYGNSGSGGTDFAFSYGLSSTEGYDDVDNPLNERWWHDNNSVDNYNYNDRYELTGVEYRAFAPTDYRTSPGGYTDMFDYDDNFNRKSASFADPFNNETAVDSNYQVSAANEYTSFDRAVNGGAPSTLNPAHDRAGNMTTIPLMPRKGVDAGQDVNGNAVYDAFNRIFTLKPGSIRKQHYRYDAFGRRIARFEQGGYQIAEPVQYTQPLPGGGGGPAPGTGGGGTTSGPIVGPTQVEVRPLNTIFAGSCRYIWDGWSVIEEREFETDTTLSDGASILERVYLNGKSIDEPILVAIDGDGDRLLNTNKNIPGGTDFEYYYATNRMGSIVGLLGADTFIDSGSVERMPVLEHYRYSAYGDATVLPIVDANMDMIDDTPNSLDDNNAAMIDERDGVDNIIGTSDDVQKAGRVSKFNNQYMYTGRRLDEKTGLHYYRYRYYESRMGRFVGRDPSGRVDGINLYSYCANGGTWCTDALGLEWITPQDGKVTDGDFKHEPSRQGGAHAAMIMYRITLTDPGSTTYEYTNKMQVYLEQCPGGCPGDGTMHINGWEVSCSFGFYGIDAQMNTQGSWKANAKMKQTTLEHEQGHYDIALLFARAYQSWVYGLTATGTGCTEKQAEKKCKRNLESKRVAKEDGEKTMFGKMWAEMENFQEMYDNEIYANTGIFDLDIQNRWREAIANALGANQAAYADPVANTIGSLNHELAEIWRREGP